jgi:hypothetical protein
MKTLKRSLIDRIKDRQAANLTDYVDFNRLDPAIICVAIDAVDSRDLKGRVVFEAGRPVAYSDPVRFVDGRWIFAGKRPGDMPKLRPAYVPAEAIIGPLPEASESLRMRRP